jgi:hypothetical protein
VGIYATRTGTRVRILLKAAEDWNDEAIARALDVGQVTIERTHQRFVEEGWGRIPVEGWLLAILCDVVEMGRPRSS